MPPLAVRPGYLDVKQLAHLLGVSTGYICQLARKGKLPKSKLLHGYYRYWPVELLPEILQRRGLL